ncbi:MAG: HlyD family efflux transporter periplasmic adaptor subunit [Bacteroidales bacterium]|nr:HlyD family efflux transporter periplasmic adaptor subunit [Bacteroidales bacterium]
MKKYIVHEGEWVKTGECIARLSNPNLELEMKNHEVNLKKALNDLKSAQLTVENQLQNIQTRITDLSFQLLKHEKALDHAANAETLVNEYEYNKQQYEITREQIEVLKEKLISDSIYMAKRYSIDKESIDELKEHLNNVICQEKELVIKAPFDGKLSILKLQTGEMVGYGSRVGIITNPASLKIHLKIDEHYLPQMNKELPGQLDYSGNKYMLKITKIYPDVQNGMFGVDMQFIEEVPESLKIGQKVHIRLELGETEKTLLLRKGSFYHSTGGQWVYVLNKKW